MAEFTQPSEIARETLRRLTARRTPPTPDNYRTIYHEIAGTREAEVFPERPLKSLASRLPRAIPLQARFVQQIDAAIGGRDWNALTTSLTALLKEFEAEPPAWRELIGDLLVQIERRHAALTAAQKREAIEHVLEASGSDPQNLFERLRSLLRSWAKTPQGAENPALAEAIPATVETIPIPIPPPPPPPPPAIQEILSMQPRKDSDSAAELRELVALLLESSMSTLLVDTPDLAEEATTLATEVRSAHEPATLAGLTRRLKQFTYRLQFVAEDQTELKASLQKLLLLIIENITELVDDDKWLRGQVAMVVDLCNEPLNLHRLNDVERRLKDVIIKQGMLKKNLGEAKQRLKTMLAGFVDHLASFSASTSDYQDKIGRCAEKISAADDLATLNDVIEEVMRETRIVQLNAERSRDNLNALKMRVEESEREIERLQTELAEASELVRHDQLTGALNRKGLDETFEREITRAARRNSPFCVALLDVDNFKQLNDTYGHQTGDEALIHLAGVIRATLRPNDTLARYGGEEFLILLPDTDRNSAVTALRRLQRELTRQFFLADNQKLLITFSAGVTQLRAEETQAQVLSRADAAMYQAKREGKNRVVAAD